MAAKKSNKSSTKKKTGVEPFEEENDDGLEINDEEEDEMAAETARSKARRVSAEADEDEEDIEDETDDEEDTGDEDEASGFAPWIYHKEAEWTLEAAFEAADEGDDVIIYDVDNTRWWKLSEIQVGEVPSESPESS